MENGGVGGERPLPGFVKMQHRSGIDRTIQPEFDPGHSVDEVVVDKDSRRPPISRTGGSAIPAGIEEPIRTSRINPAESVAFAIKVRILRLTLSDNNGLHSGEAAFQNSNSRSLHRPPPEFSKRFGDSAGWEESCSISSGKAHANAGAPVRFRGWFRPRLRR